MTTLRNVNANTLANLADVAAPDSEASPGAVFLVSIADTLADYLRYAEDDGQGIESLEDSIHEIADGAVPIYTYEMWKVFVDLAAWREDVTEFGALSGDDGGMEKGAQVALYLIAERLVRALIEDIENGDEEE